jgi:putative pyruvate formate lyase activating enzyme
LVRHLLLPNNLAGSEAVFRFLADKVSKNVYLNIMAQYHPAYHAREYPELSRRIRPDEYRDAVNLAKQMGLTRLDR